MSLLKSVYKDILIGQDGQSWSSSFDEIPDPGEIFFWSLVSHEGWCYFMLRCATMCFIMPCLILWDIIIHSYGQQPYGAPPGQHYQTATDQAYNYYATHDPLSNFTAPPLGPPQYPNQTANQQPALSQRRQQQPPQQQQGQYGGQSQRTPRDMGKEAAAGAFPSDRNSKDQKKANQMSYQNELKQQVSSIP